MKELAEYLKTNAVLVPVKVGGLAKEKEGKKNLGGRRTSMSRLQIYGQTQINSAIVDNNVSSDDDSTIQSLIIRLRHGSLGDVNIENAFYRQYKQKGILSYRKTGKLFGKGKTTIANYINVKVDIDYLNHCPRP